MCTEENPCLVDINDNDWNLDHPLGWKTVNFLENVSNLKFETLQQGQERIEDTLAMLDSAPQTAEDEGAKELAAKQHAIWIAKFLNNSWSKNVTAEMNAFEEDTKGDGILQFHIFLHENIGHAN
jgi:hypothetical protein